MFVQNDDKLEPSQLVKGLPEEIMSKKPLKLNEGFRFQI